MSLLQTISPITSPYDLESSSLRSPSPISITSYYPINDNSRHLHYQNCFRLKYTSRSTMSVSTIRQSPSFPSPSSTSASSKIRTTTSPSVRISRLASTNESNDNKLCLTKSNLVNDPFLSQYLKPQQDDKSSSSSNYHQLYFNSINHNRKIKLFEIYQKYFITNDDSSHDWKSYLNYNNNHNHIRLDEVRKSPLVDTLLEPPVKIQKSIASPKKLLTNKKLIPSPVISSIKSPLLKSLPPQFMNCPIDDLIILISRMLQSLIVLNDKQVPQISENGLSNQLPKKILTRYHSRTPPSISTHTYLSRLTKFNNFNPATLLTTIYYIDLLSHNYQPFFTLNSWTVHRFLLVATMLAQKSMEDFFYTNDHYAKVGGVAINELNCLEIDFLNRVDWRVIPAKHLEDGTLSIKYSKNVLDLYYVQLIQLMGKINNESEVVYVQSNINDEDEDESIESDYEERDMEDDDEEEEEDDEGEDDEYDEEDGMDLSTSPQAYYDSKPSKYNSQGYSHDNSSSPHLKRRYSMNFNDE